MTDPIRVLVVDDDFRVAAMHAAALSQLAECVVAGQATTLAQARAVLANAPVDLVVADEYLPDGSGTDLVGASDASVLMVTAANTAAKVRRALRRGAVGYILKPFAMPVLLERVADYARFRDAGPLDQVLTQADIDDIAGQLRPRPRQAQLPKGRSSVTANAITTLLRSNSGPLTAVTVAEAIGISRATAQRYLSDLVADGTLSLSLRYGATGRPEHSYEWIG